MERVYGSGASQIKAAEEALRLLLVAGQKSSVECLALIEGFGVSRSSLRRAKKRLGVVSVAEVGTDGRVSGWSWRLPADYDPVPFD